LTDAILGVRAARARLTNSAPADVVDRAVGTPVTIIILRRGAIARAAIIAVSVPIACRVANLATICRVRACRDAGIVDLTALTLAQVGVFVADAIRAAILPSRWDTLAALALVTQRAERTVVANHSVLRETLLTVAVAVAGVGLIARSRRGAAAKGVR
jgi:hypothetical protein